MLIFFIHGVAERSSQYAYSLQSLLEKEFSQHQEKLPLFYSGFWGNVYRELEIIWNRIDNAQNPLRHQNFRKGYFSQFVGDAFTYLGSERGERIRGILADQLIDFIQKNPQETELHIITHSLGSVILWDILFSDNFLANDPALTIRTIFSQSSETSPSQKINLKSITTMGSPISLFNIMLEIKPHHVSKLSKQYSSQNLRWLNIIHASDLIAYPIHPVLDTDNFSNLSLTEEYLHEDVNPFEATLRQLSEFIQNKPTNNQSNLLDYAQVAAGSVNAHINYWVNEKAANLIVNHILENPKNLNFNQDSFRHKAIQRLKRVPGFTIDNVNLSERLNWNQVICEISFKDWSGYLKLTRNRVGGHQVYIYDDQGISDFTGYVGLIHVNALKTEVNRIEREFCVESNI